MMKKILFVLLIFFIVGCSNKEQLNTIDLEGYWSLIAVDKSGYIENITDMKYLEITKDKLNYYVLDDEVEVTIKYYKLEGNDLYYDFYKFKDKDWKENIDELAGGKYVVSFESENLVLTKFYNSKDKTGGYEKETYKKTNMEEWIIK